MSSKGLRSELLEVDSIDRAVEQFGGQLQSSLAGVSSEITDGEDWYYIAEGTRDLLGTDPLAPICGVPADGRIRMVAGGGFEPPTFGL